MKRATYFHISYVCICVQASASRSSLFETLRFCRKLAAAMGLFDCKAHASSCIVRNNTFVKRMNRNGRKGWIGDRLNAHALQRIRITRAAILFPCLESCETNGENKERRRSSFYAIFVMHSLGALRLCAHHLSSLCFALSVYTYGVFDSGYKCLNRDQEQPLSKSVISFLVPSASHLHDVAPDEVAWECFRCTRAFGQHGAPLCRADRSH